MSAVFRDFARYEATIRENITVSDTNRRADTEELTQLAKRTGAWEFIEHQPSGFDEVVGSFSATGNNLSGGQWQKIALTRCAYREDAKIMILDEPKLFRHTFAFGVLLHQQVEHFIGRAVDLFQMGVQLSAEKHGVMDTFMVLLQKVFPPSAPYADMRGLRCDDIRDEVITLAVVGSAKIVK
jgi:ABC-type uncharacterized transport system ATPase subunit